MRLIINESQLQFICQEETVARILQEQFAKNPKIKKIMEVISWFLATGVSVAVLIAAINHSDIPAQDKEELTRLTKIEASNHNAIKQADSTYKEKIKAVESYMDKALKNQNYTWKSTHLTPSALVKASIEHNFDLPFLMAVAHQESCFGAAPRARRTNSVFSEGLYDNGHNAVTYSHPNASVVGFINLLNNDYLIDGKKLSDLLKPGAFVNHNGHRYASDPNYERKISYLRNKIASEYPQLVS